MSGSKAIFHKALKCDIHGISGSFYLRWVVFGLASSSRLEGKMINVKSFTRRRKNNYANLNSDNYNNLIFNKLTSSKCKGLCPRGSFTEVVHCKYLWKKRPKRII